MLHEPPHPSRSICLVIAILLAAFGLYRWWDYISMTLAGYSAGGVNGQAMAILFAIWAVPIILAVLAVIISYRWSHVLSKVVTVLGGLVILSALITSVVGAQ